MRLQPQGLLLDIDDTLYDYETAHTAALAAVTNLAARSLDLDPEAFRHAYARARQRVHLTLHGSAASHNRLLYFQLALESLRRNPLRWALRFDQEYWDAFLGAVRLRDGVFDLLERFRGRLCFVTDLVAAVQFRKVVDLKLFEYSERMVTSEEAGHEKPHPHIFLLGVQKLGLAPAEAVMIGDSYEKDVVGAWNAGITPVWFNPSRKPLPPSGPAVVDVDSFSRLLEVLHG